MDCKELQAKHIAEEGGRNIACCVALGDVMRQCDVADVVCLVYYDNIGIWQAAAERTEAGMYKRRRGGYALKPTEPDGDRCGGYCSDGLWYSGTACGEAVN